MARSCTRRCESETRCSCWLTPPENLGPFVSIAFKRTDTVDLGKCNCSGDDHRSQTIQERMASVRGARCCPAVPGETSEERPSIADSSQLYRRRVKTNFIHAEDCVRDVGILYDFHTGKHGFSKLHRHAKAQTDNWL